MKNIILTVFTVLIFGSCVYAASTKEDAMAFFNHYVQAANTYNPEVTTMYSPSAKIIREVVKPDGTTVTRVTNTQRYISEMKKGQTIAKMRHYKNNYSNISISQLGADTFKIASLRQPSGESYKLKTYMVIKKQPDGVWLITEEMMQTKVQMLINAK
ncbi:MAG: hypothetical protein LUB59_01520 [Candidatus Gastranaerophilales bacterium]|nr:hypothetical protein [Candidatus Gastranaerophilales bacterium]